MQRRHLLQMMGLTSVSTLCPLTWAAINGQSADQLWLVMYAEGGWDPVSFCNPRSGDYVTTNNLGVSNSRGKISSYPQSFIQKLGPFEYVPAVTPTATPGFGPFLEKYYQSLLVINGIEMGTNGHQEGRIKAVSGAMGSTYPCFAAYAAATSNAKTSMPFLASGRPYNNTANLTTRIDLKGVPFVSQIAHSQLTMGNQAVVNDNILSDLETAQLTRLQKQITDSVLPRFQQELQAFYDAKLNRNELRIFKAKLPQNYNADPRYARMQDICAAMAAGLTVSAHFDTQRFFDTHNNHDVVHAASLNDYFMCVDFLIQEAERQGIRDRLNIIMLSDFGRPPFYNDANGKDHWSTGSMLFMGPDFKGNRMIQASDSLVRSVKVNLKTFLPDDKGEYISAEMINRTLRSLTGNTDHNFDQRFVINTPSVPALFTG